MAQGLQKSVGNPVEQIGFVVDTNAKPDKCFTHLLVQFKRGPSKLSKFTVSASETHIFKYYYWLFVMSILAYRRSRWEYSKKTDWPKKEPISFPLTENVDPKEIKHERDLYRFMVRYYYNLVKANPNRYTTFPKEICKLRDSVVTIFKPTDHQGRKWGSEKGKAIELFPGVKNQKIEQAIFFCKKEDFPGFDLNDPGLNQIDISNRPQPGLIDGEILDRVLDDIRKSDFWKRWEETAEKKRNAVKAKGNVTKKKSGLFMTTEDILRMDISSRGPFKEPTWFRPSGPLAIDFQNRRVHVNKEKVAALKEHVLNHQVSMLESPAATGKTVLVRSLAFETYKNEKLDFFYFDCDSKRFFSPAELADEIESTEGIFIIENMHLEARKLAPMIAELRNLTNRHILFTSRPLFRKRDYLSPDELKVIHFFPQPGVFEDANDIIDLYFSGAHKQPLSLEKHNRIKKVTSGNYKMLGYALEGCEQKKGKGEPEEWIEEGVKRELQRLEYVLEGPKGPNQIFPEIVLALSPLYMKEILTEESFLRDGLYFDKEDFQALNALVELGEVTSQRTSNGHVFYGLPHSVQAKAYWNYGTLYKNRRELKEHETFVHDYVALGIANSLEIISKSPIALQETLTTKLVENGNLGKVIKYEPSFCNIAHWSEKHLTVKFFNKDVASSLSNRLNNAEAKDTVNYLSRLDSEIENMVWRSIDRHKFANKMLTQNYPERLISYLHYFQEHKKYIGKEVCELIQAKLSMRLQKEGNPLNICYCIEAVRSIDKTIGENMWFSSLRKVVALLLISMKPIQIISYLKRLKVFWAKDLLIRKDINQAINKICDTKDIDDLCHFADIILYTRFNKKHIVEMLSPYKIGKALRNSDNSDHHFFVLLKKLCRLDSRLFESVIKNIDTDEIVKRTISVVSASHLVDLLRIMFYMRPTIAWDLWHYLDHKKIGNKLSREKDMFFVTKTLSSFFAFAKTPAIVLVKNLDCGLIAKTLRKNKSNVLEKTVLENIGKIDQKTARKIFNLIITGRIIP